MRYLCCVGMVCAGVVLWWWVGAVVCWCGGILVWLCVGAIVCLCGGVFMLCWCVSFVL